jgi:hypothetical protein
LVLLNKGDDAVVYRVSQWLSYGSWRDADRGEIFNVTAAQREIVTELGAHDARVLLFDAATTDPGLLAELHRLQSLRQRKSIQ